MEQNYRISFKIGDSSFEIESSDANWLEKKEKEFFQKLLNRAPKRKGEAKDEEAEETETLITPEITLNEFYHKYVKKFKTRTNIAVMLVYYLQKVMKKDKIKSTDVANCFRDIAYPNWNKLNMTDVLSRSRHRALLNYVNKLWSLTTTGEDFVLNTISGKTK